LLCKYFAEELGLKEPEKMFICGLLHNVVELIVAQLDPKIAKKYASISIESSPLILQKSILAILMLMSHLNS
jgi:HD-like signal output (HDOD) protein